MSENQEEFENRKLFQLSVNCNQIFIKFLNDHNKTLDRILVREKAKFEMQLSSFSIKDVIKED